MPAMDIQQIRRERLRKYVEEQLDGNRAALARLTNRQPSFFSDLFASRKSFGEKLARALEAQLPGLSPGDLDVPRASEPDAVDDHSQADYSSEQMSEAELNRLWRTYPVELKARIISLVETVQESVSVDANNLHDSAQDAVRLRRERMNRRRQKGDRRDAG